jgi:hypothetical protein
METAVCLQQHAHAEVRGLVVERDRRLAALVAAAELFDQTQQRRCAARYVPDEQCWRRFPTPHRDSSVRGADSPERADDEPFSLHGELI